MDYLRKKVVYVPQETVLFSMSILENMKLGIEETFNETKFIRICEVCCLTEIFDKSEGFLHYRISENGRDLSGGQKQIIGIVRALIMNPRVLILDEATSQLDSELEKRIISNILQFNEKMTCIHITHNMELLKKYNKIVTLE